MNPPPIRKGDTARVFAILGCLIAVGFAIVFWFFFPKNKVTLFSAAVTLSYGDSFNTAVDRMGKPEFCTDQGLGFQECEWKRSNQTIRAKVHNGKLEELSGAENDSWQDPAVFQVVFDGP